MSSASSSSSLSQERDTKIFFAVVPTLLAIGILLPDDWLAVITGNPLMAILTGFGMLGRENYMLEDNNKNGAAQEEHDAVVPRLLKSSTSSMSTASTTESSTCSTIASMNYAEDTLEIEGIQVPVGCEVNGTHLDRHGSALRCFAFFRGISIRVYVATLYSPRQLSNGLEILESLESHDASPLQMDFTFLRGFTAGQCKKAWEKQLDESVSYRYEGFEQDKADFLDMIATQPMKANGTVTVQILEDDDTITMMIFDQGTWTGEIVGKDFQRAFLSMWFGDKPVTDELKSGLLGQTL
ncbi:unnamed protein product [Cylindrotheca closterium]|uniref:Chalcone isomerase domain-containing protein n=1 Tax=Cylindrotheca closterium TaxID=2856 RepID=A0AAD2PUC3_9STRA|nr:unnamed protein product [Cylindrotheca closterium]